MGKNTGLIDSILETHHTFHAKEDDNFIKLETPYEIEEVNALIHKRNSLDSKEKLFPTHSMEKESEKLTKPNYLGYTNFTKNYFLVSQKWMGHVLDITEQSFSAKIEDINKGGTHEIADFDINEVSPGDLSLLKKGAAFYWSVGFAMDMGQRKKQSLLIFQRLPEWTEEDYDHSIDKAADLYENLNWA